MCICHVREQGARSAKEEDHQDKNKGEKITVHIIPEQGLGMPFDVNVWTADSIRDVKLRIFRQKQKVLSAATAM